MAKSDIKRHLHTDALSFLFQIQSLEASLSTIPPFLQPCLRHSYIPMRGGLALRHGRVIAGGRRRGCAFGHLTQEEKLPPQGNIRNRPATPTSSQNDDASDYPSSEDDWLQRHRVERLHSREPGDPNCRRPTFSLVKTTHPLIPCPPRPKCMSCAR